MLYTHYCTVGKYSLINPSPLCFFGGGVFWHEQLIKFFLASTCDFSSLPLSLLLSALISTKPSQRCIRVPGHHSRRSRFPILFFFSLSGRDSLHNTSILSTYTHNPIFRDAEKRESKKRKKKEKNELPRVCRIRTKTYTHTHLHTYIPIVGPTPPSVFKRVPIVYLPTYLTYLTSLAPVNFRKSYVYLKATLPIGRPSQIVTSRLRQLP